MSLLCANIRVKVCLLFKKNLYFKKKINVIFLNFLLFFYISYISFFIEEFIFFKKKFCTIFEQYV